MRTSTLAAFFRLSVLSGFIVGTNAVGYAGGQLTVWGMNAALTNIPAGLVDVVAVSAGESHLVVLKADGSVAAWGNGRVYSPSGGGFSNPATTFPPDFHTGNAPETDVATTIVGWQLFLPGDRSGRP